MRSLAPRLPSAPFTLHSPPLRVLQGNDVLQQRVWRMLHMEADPLDSSSSSRYRLRLREADDAFFRTNVMEVGLDLP